MEKQQILPVRDDILEFLRCSACQSPLSVGPVQIQTKTGAFVCGRCACPSTGIRDTPYEKVAQMLLFPCRYVKHGCTMQEKFNDIKKHEDNCSFKVYSCPIETTGACYWVGQRKEIAKHCSREHSENYLQHPCTISHNFSESYSKTFLTEYEDNPFLIDVKVCLASQKLFHCVRFIGDQDFALNFEFFLKMETPSSTLSKCKGCMPFSTEIKDDKSLVTSITGLTEIFENLITIKFILTLRKTQNLSKCMKCNEVSRKTLYKIKHAYRCENCLLLLYECCEQCPYRDTKSKIQKHQKYFCNSLKKGCIICQGPIFESTFKNHITHRHSNMIHNSGSFWQFQIPEFEPNSLVSKKQLYAIHTVIGLVYCEIYKCRASPTGNIIIFFHIFAPLSTEQLSMYDCNVEIVKKDMNFKVNMPMKKDNDQEADWTGKLEHTCVYPNLDIKITFSKKDKK